MHNNPNTECDNLNKGNVEQVGKLVDVDPSDIKRKNRRKVTGYVIHYFVQVFVFLLSSLFGYLFILWENADQSSYPYGTFPRHLYLGPISLYGLFQGNAIFTYFHRKKHKFRNIEVFPVVFVNLIVSLISFFMIFNAIYQGPAPTLGVAVAYGIYEKENPRSFKKVMKI